MIIEPNDGLPQNICGKCKDDVHIALDLRNRSLQSETALKQKYNSNSSSYTENIVENSEIISKFLENHDNSNENCEDYDNIDGFPELKVEIECDRIEQDGGETKWLPEGTVKKLTKKEKRQQYLDLVDGELDPEGPVRCKICKKTVSNWKCFISHAKLHLGFNFVCEFCGKSFISTTQLKRHCRSYHGMSRELPCPHCDYLALDNAQLKLHERRMHTFERPFSCDECGAAYHSRRCLVQHIETHRTEATVQCEQCPLTFKSSRQLSRHRYRTHKYQRADAKFINSFEHT
ncbi:zinc finger protein 569-like [Helicoverpa armigera]|uniref:zinc finger protein 569-like n=1 Tax=Helicoverpa armigera TaxID=29058 RepID=UPI0030827FAE